MRRMYSENQLNNVIDERLGSGQIPSAKMFENIVDKDGHKRFIEGEIAIETITGVTKTYGKWSLSGSHLLVVLCLNVENTTALVESQVFCTVNVPAWVKDKIVPLFGTIVERKAITFYNNVDGSTQTGNANFRKQNNTLSISLASTITFTKDRGCRIAFDLLIDNN